MFGNDTEALDLLRKVDTLPDTPEAACELRSIIRDVVYLLQDTRRDLTDLQRDYETHTHERSNPNA